MSPASNGPAKVRNALGATAAPLPKGLADKVFSVLDRLDAMDDGSFRNRRNSSRNTYRKLDVPVRVYHPGGSSAVRTVATRNLSASGIGFLYPSFLHLGTKVEVVLNRRLGGEDVIRGATVFCSHVGGVFHQIGVKFDQKIFTNLYLDAGQTTEEPVEPATSSDKDLVGKILYVEDNQTDLVQFKHFLKSTRLDVTGVLTGKEAVQAVANRSFDLLLTDLNLESTTGEALIPELRTAGYTGPIYLVTGESTPARLMGAQQAGALGILSKPYDQSKLHALLRTWLKITDGEPLISSVANQPDMLILLPKYVSGLKELANELKSQLETDNLNRLRHVCTSLKGTASSYGFAPIADAAAQATQQIDTTLTVSGCASQIQKLIDLCRRATDRSE
jgi:CheY-like chemotaxis protein